MRKPLSIIYAATRLRATMIVNSHAIYIYSACVYICDLTGFQEFYGPLRGR